MSSPSRLDDPLSGHPTYVHQLPDASTTYQCPSNPTSEGMYPGIFQPMLPNAHPMSDEYWFFQPSLWDATTTTESSENFQPHPSPLLPMEPDNLRVPIEPAVASFYACLPHRSNESQTQPQNNDLDPAINTPVLPHSYDPWSGQLSYDGVLPHHRPDH